MAQQLTVKAYLQRQGDQGDEIRRFAVDLDVSTNYEYLLAKLRNVFPGFANKPLTLYWKDADNDMIAFSSDDEMMEAVKNITDGMFRVYVVEKASPTSSWSGPAGAYGSGEQVHRGVTCDGCNEGPLRGIRYKCTVCPDYDLCGRCKGTGLHSEHEMRTIERPMMPWVHLFDAMPQPEQPAGPPPPMPPPPPYGGCPPFPPHPGCDTAEARRMQRRQWKRWWREMYGKDHKRKCCKKERKDEKKMKKEEKKKAAEAGNKQKTTSSSSSSDSDADHSPNTEYLRNVGHSVAAMLDPLGIDVEVDVERHGHRRRCHPGFMRGHGHSYWAARGMRGGGCGPGAWAGMRGRRGGWGCPWARAQSGFSQPTASTPAEPSAAEQTGQHNKPDTNSETGEMASGQFAGADADWTMVNNGRENGVEGATEGVSQLHVTPAVEAVPAMPADPRIGEAVEQMMAMGYSNEGGWLAQLLDAIHAKK